MEEFTLLFPLLEELAKRQCSFHFWYFPSFSEGGGKERPGLLRW